MDTPNLALRTSQLISSNLHFWWVAFLRCSKDYWWICQQKGQCLDTRLVKVWQDFGDVQRYWREDQRWTPNMPAASRDQQYARWKKAVSRTLNWIEDAQ